MNLKSILLIPILLLSSCGLQVSPQLNEAPPAVTAPASLPSTTAAAAPSSAPIRTAPAETEDARTILQKSALAMLAAESYTYTSENRANFGGEDVVSRTEAVIFPSSGDGRIEATQDEMTATTYLKDHRMYMTDPVTGGWVYLEMDQDTPVDPVIDERVNDYMAVVREGKDLVLTAQRPLSALEFYSLTGIEIREAATLQAMEAAGQTMETMVTFVLDESYRYKTRLYEQVTTVAGVSTYNASTVEYADYDQAPAVTVPSHILEEARRYDPADSQ